MSDERRRLRNGRYELVRALGEGTQAETFEALDTGSKATLTNKWDSYVAEARTGKKPAQADPRGRVAIKCFRIGKAKAWKDVELAEREAKVLQSLSHPNLPRYIEHFEEDGALYLVMEKIEGESLAAIRARGGSQSSAEVLRMLADVGAALKYLHGRAPPVVHRDIKPGNILRRPDGSYVLVDFGAVRDKLKPSGGSTVVGTFGFMAPEQFQGRASPRSDLYGLAATAIVMLTGEEPEDLPHEGLGIDVPKAVPRSAPRPLVRALAAMLEPDPDRRAHTIDEALAHLKESLPPPKEKKERFAPSFEGASFGQQPWKPRNRREARQLKKHRKREDRRMDEARRKMRHARRIPFVPRVIARLGLFIGWITVWIVAGVVMPALLMLLSLILGKSLRHAAKVTFESANTAHRKIARASRRLSGYTEEDEKERVRVAEFDRVRAVTPSEAQRIAIDEAEARGEDADEWMAERLDAEERREEEQRAQRDRMRSHAQRKHWGR